MKTFYLLLCLLCLPQLCPAQDEGIRFENLSYREALAKARATGKKVFIDCYTKTCGPCKFMARVVFPKKACGDYFNPQFISIKQDMEEGDGPEIGKKYHVRMYPTFLFLNPDGSVYLNYAGGAEKDPEVFVQKLKDNFRLADYGRTFEAGSYDEAFLAEYLDLLEKHSPARLQTVMGQAMADWEVEKLCRPAHWERLERVLRNPGNPLFRRILAQRAEFGKQLGESKVKAYLLSVCEDEFRMFKANADLDQRRADLQPLADEGWQPAKLLLCRMEVCRIVSKKQTERTDELLAIVQGLPREFPAEADRVAVLEELSGLARFLKGSPRRDDFRTALQVLLPSSAQHPGVVQSLLDTLP